VTVRIIPTAEPHISGFHAAVAAVARERRYLSFVVGPPIEQSTAFVRGLLASGGVQFVAVSDTDEVVGWCDVVRAPLEGFRHIGRLGMGLLPAYRGAGYGRRLAEKAIAAAQQGGIERIELEVFATNAVAIRLYERLGFQHEGVKRNGRKLDGIYDDNVLMALVQRP
jgi:RimJ/RimL family protein N-acetyltransferase